MYENLTDGVVGISAHAMKMHLSLLEKYGDELDALSTKVDSLGPSDWLIAMKRGAFLRNAVLLHDIFFESLMSPDATTSKVPPPDFEARIVKRFGSFQKMLERLRVAASGGNSWGLLVEPEPSDVDDLIDVCTVEDHHIGSLARINILFALDGWEHSYWYDYGPSKDTYLHRVLASSIDWTKVAAASRKPARKR